LRDALRASGLYVTPCGVELCATIAISHAFPLSSLTGVWSALSLANPLARLATAVPLLTVPGS
jgi:hypothetical protein